jgi:hypothetical protein
MMKILKIDDLKLNEYYLFLNLKINIFNDQRTLQSTKSTKILNK